MYMHDMYMYFKTNLQSSVIRQFTCTFCRSIDEYSPAEGGGHFEVVALLKSIGSFIGIFIGSFILGTAMGLLTALVGQN